MDDISAEPSQGYSGIWEDDSQRRYTQCANWKNHQICNWMLPETPADNPQSANDGGGSAEALCLACALNDIIPDLAVSGNQPLWHKLEMAKRRCLFTLLELRLPIYGGNSAGSSLNPPPLSFRFMSDKTTSSHFQHPIGGKTPVLTGHSDGVITINLAEADDIALTQIRVAMQERYRTLLGHFRHESGHYFWEVLKCQDTNFVASFRSAFGDESLNYQDALNAHYEQGPPDNWQNNFVSTYATMHPWEDWAETWAHYLHMIDTLETLESLTNRSERLSEPNVEVKLPFAVGSGKHHRRTDFDEIVKLWIDASILLNSLNRSMGLADPYPFVLHHPIQDKLRFVHDSIERASHYWTAT